MLRVQCRALSLSTGAASHSHAYYIFCGSRLLQDIWLEKPDIKECRSLMFADSMCKNDQPCALLAPPFSCSLLMS